MNPRIVFFGTPDFATPALRALVSAGLRPVAVVTQPPEPTGRHQKITPSAIASEAKKLNLLLVEPRSIKTDVFARWFSDQKPDVAVLVAYGKILPQNILAIPLKGFINVHPSLLPQHRGASPIAGAILAADKTTGVTIMQLDAKMDHGPILSQRTQAVLPGDTTQTLSSKLATLGADLLIQSLPDYLNGELSPRPQDHSRATYTKLLKRSDGQIDWTVSAAEVERRVRAMNPWPGTYTCLNGKRLKILKAHIASASVRGDPGLLVARKNELQVVCADGAIVLDTVQLAGKKPQTAQEFLNGHGRLVGAKVEACPDLPRAQDV